MTLAELFLAEEHRRGLKSKKIKVFQLFQRQPSDESVGMDEELPMSESLFVT